MILAYVPPSATEDKGYFHRACKFFLSAIYFGTGRKVASKVQEEVKSTQELEFNTWALAAGAIL